MHRKLSNQNCQIGNEKSVCIITQCFRNWTCLLITERMDCRFKSKVTFWSICHHLKVNLRDTFQISYDELDFVRNPFTFSVEKVSDECQDKFLDLVNDSSPKQVYHEKLLTEFWIEIKNSYSKITEKALRILIPFVSTYLCEAGFSTLLQIKTKQRNKLHVEDDLPCALSQTSPRIQRLSNNKQKQVSH